VAFILVSFSEEDRNVGEDDDENKWMEKKRVMNGTNETILNVRM
jgi:hypothetical protein